MSKWVNERESNLDLSLIVWRCYIPNFRVLASILPAFSQSPSILNQSRPVSKRVSEKRREEVSWISQLSCEDATYQISPSYHQYYHIFINFLQFWVKVSQLANKWETKWSLSLTYCVNMLNTKFQSPSISITRFISLSFNFESN